jgi:hydroxylamine reductase
MFCYQCEQTSKGTGCSAYGVCGKDPEAAALQDLIFYAVKGAAIFLNRARRLGASESHLEPQLFEGVFLTLTDANFDGRVLELTLQRMIELRLKARRHYESAEADTKGVTTVPDGPATFAFGKGISELYHQAETISIEVRTEQYGEDLVGIQEFLSYGIKGAAGYAWHAIHLGKESPTFNAFFCEALDALSDPKTPFEALQRLCMRCGEENLKVLQVLDTAHTERFGNPVPTDVRITPVAGKSILVSGHSLHDLESLLQKTTLNVYTHGEMLPAHAYPYFKKYKNLIGNYGGAWQDQAREFDAFPGPIVVTTNCIQKPLASYANRLFTSGPAGWPGVTHLDGSNWNDVIEAALVARGFTQDEPEKRISIGFGRTALLERSEKIASLLKSGELKNLYLVGGCDGAKLGRNHYTDLATSVPPNGMVLTFACGKYRFNKQEFGTVHDMPRLLDVGQCNDSYSLIQLLNSLSQRLREPVSELPVVPVLSWFEQKSIAYLLTLLSIGVHNIQLGPTLPAFFSPRVYGWLNKEFGLQMLRPIDKGRVNAILT